MDDMAGAGHKSQRHTTNKIKDLYNMNRKHDEGKSIPIEINGGDDNMKSSKTDKNTEHGDLIMVNREEYEFLVEKSASIEKEKDELKEQLLRKIAEMENFRRRTLLEKQQLIEFGNEKLLASFLSVVDDFSNALEVSRKTDAESPILKGIELIYQKTLKFLSDSGVKPIESYVGKPFDVHLHEAIMMMPSDYPEGIVVQEVLTGYMIGEKVLRHTKVITSSGPAQN